LVRRPRQTCEPGNSALNSTGQRKKPGRRAPRDPKHDRVAARRQSPEKAANREGERVLSPTSDRIVGKRQTGARAEILGDPRRRIWEQHDESLEASEKRVEAEAEALHQTAK
jgi:hypothetical protein